ncbi:poly [ADP-ribose] polymerase 11-like [Pomacea canaliculata]|nr:poly [ADP-ribose] polymerase 11-like [Pomacea canaliculata]
MVYHSHGYTYFRPIAKLPGSSGPVQTTESVPRESPLRRQIYPFKANEHYLFHGTKEKNIQNIMNTGLDSRLTSDKAMLGQGIYFAESPTKADQYTDDKDQRTSGEKTMVLVRVVLGNPFINTSSDPDKFKRPPCKWCFKDLCSCDDPSYFDSVIDDAGRNFREFVVYDRSMCYPEYFITYNRV